MPKRKTNEQFVKEIKSILPNIELLEEYINNRTKIKCKCITHNNTFMASPKHLLNGQIGCPICSIESRHSKRTKTNEQFLKELEEKYIDVIPLEKYNGRNKLIMFKCSCGKLWKTTPERVLLGNHCQKCRIKNMSGANSRWYNPNLTDEDRQDRNHRFRNPEYVKFVKDCFERDNYTCQITGKKSTGDIIVHHINGYNWDINNRTNINNGITLNKEIHKEFHKMYGKGDNTKEQFIEFLDYLYKNNRIELNKLNLLKERLNSIK